MLKKILKWTGIILLIVFIAIQFVRPEKNKSATASANAIQNKYSMSDEVKNILTVACFDCHSNNTRYPWYSEVQPVAWWLDNHIKDGKKGLNFDEFLGYSIRKQYKRLEDVNELVKENKMPLNSYLWIHKDAKLSDQQKLTLANWAENIRDSIRANYPPDSLIGRKKG
jgi:hypothetical protein